MGKKGLPKLIDISKSFYFANFNFEKTKFIHFRSKYSFWSSTHFDSSKNK